MKIRIIKDKDGWFHLEKLSILTPPGTCKSIESWKTINNSYCMTERGVRRFLKKYTKEFYKKDEIIEELEI